MNSDCIRRTALIAAVLAFSLIGAGSAHATVGPANGGEPPTTKGTSNTWFFAYTPVSTGYQVCYTVYKDGVVIKDFPKNYPTGYHPPAGGQCTNVAYGANQSALLTRTETGLQHGSRYEICAVSFENYEPRGASELWFMRVKTLDSCSRTTIDNGAPALQTWVGGEATHTNNPIIPVHMRYEDTLSHPWSQNLSQAGAKAATIACLTRGDSCTPNAYAEGCSQPNAGRFSWTPGLKQNSFDCAYDFTQYEDGRVTFCAYQADAALTDKPNNANQYAEMNSANANQSNVACGNVILDRGAPSVDIGPDLTVKAGDLVNFSAAANDAVSGVGQIDWTFGDNTQGASGATATHTYTQPGTYIAKATTKDGAGNLGEDTRTITVQPAGTTTPGGGGTTPGGGGTTPGGGGTTPGGGGSTPGGGGTTIPSTGGIVTQPVTPSDAKTVIIRESGGSGGGPVSVGTVAIAGLDVSAPKTLKFKKGAKLPVVLDAEGPGTVSLALVKGASKVVARGGTTLNAAGTFVVRMKLPAKMKSGAYSLRVTFTPQGQTTGSTKKLSVRVSAPKASPRAAAVPEVGPPADADVAAKR